MCVPRVGFVGEVELDLASCGQRIRMRAHHMCETFPAGIERTSSRLYFYNKFNRFWQNTSAPPVKH